MNVNFAFIRHGHGCHNALGPLVKKGTLQKMSIAYLNLVDPELTTLGVDASIRNGCVISKLIRNLGKVTGDIKFNIDTIHVVGCSPLIRCMETAYYMTRKWKNPPNKIYVFPLLREIDEGSSDIYSRESRIVMETTPAYAMKQVDEQKQYLRSQGILDYFDFSYIDAYEHLRKEPGDIKEFVQWFANIILPQFDINNNQLNVFITTHAGVLRDFTHQGFTNNSGFVINCQIDHGERVPLTRALNDIQNTTPYSYRVLYNKFVSLNDYLPSYFFQDYKEDTYTSSEFYCPTSRCGQLCSAVRTPSSSLKRIDTECQNDNSENL